MRIEPCKSSIYNQSRPWWYDKLHVSSKLSLFSTSLLTLDKETALHQQTYLGLKKVIWMSSYDFTMAMVSNHNGDVCPVVEESDRLSQE